MFLDEFLDVALVARLRPPSLFVLSRLLVELLHDLVQPAVAQPEQLPLLASDHGDDRAVRTGDERYQRCQVEVAADTDAVGNPLEQRQGRPEVVVARREDRQAPGPVTLEIVVEPARDALEVALQARASIVREVRPLRLLRRREQRVHSRLRVAGRRHLRWIEVDVDADRAAVLGAEPRELAELYPGHRTGHSRRFLYHGAPILCVALRRDRLHGGARRPTARGARGDASRGGSPNARRRPALSKLTPEPAVQPRLIGGRPPLRRERVPPCARARRPAQRRARGGALRVPSRRCLPQLRGTNGHRRMAGGTP